MTGDVEVARALAWSGLALLALAPITMGVGLLLSLLGTRGGRLLPGDIAIFRPEFVFPRAASVLVSLLLGGSAPGVASTPARRRWR